MSSADTQNNEIPATEAKNPPLPYAKYKEWESMIEKGFEASGAIKSSSYIRAKRVFTALFAAGHTVISTGYLQTLMEIPNSSAADVLGELRRWGVLTELGDLHPKLAAWDEETGKDDRKIHRRTRYYMFPVSGHKTALRSLPQYQKALRGASISTVVDETKPLGGASTLTVLIKEMENNPAARAKLLDVLSS